MSNIEERRVVLNCTSYSMPGQIHVIRHEANEDVILCEEMPKLNFYGIADGQSRKKYCRIGAELALQEVRDYLVENPMKDLFSYRYVDEIRFGIINRIRKKLVQLSDNYQADICEFSSTVLALAIDSKTGMYMFVHLGDGGIIGKRTDGSLYVVSGPDNGITSAYTWLTTSQSALSHVQIGFGNVTKYNRMVMFSDGATEICKGNTINSHAAVLIEKSKDHSAIYEYVKGRHNMDDTSVVVIDVL